MRCLIALAFVALPALAGCSAPPAVHGDGGGSGGAAMSPAQMSLLMLADGQDATLVPGAQGGFHVWLKYRVAGMAPEKVKVHRESHRVSDDALVLRTDGTQDVGAPAPGNDGWWELPQALPSFMCPTPIGINVIDERIVFEVTLSTMDDQPLAKSSAEATVHCPDGTQAPFCAKICSG